MTDLSPKQYRKRTRFIIESLDDHLTAIFYPHWIDKTQSCYVVWRLHDKYLFFFQTTSGSHLVYRCQIGGIKPYLKKLWRAQGHD